jgi:hypothetical protein
MLTMQAHIGNDADSFRSNFSTQERRDHRQERRREEYRAVTNILCQGPVARNIR